MGVVTGVKKGETTVVATSGALKAEAKVMVEKPEAKAMTAKVEKER